MGIFHNAGTRPGSAIVRISNDRQHLARVEMENFLRTMTDRAIQEKHGLWKRDYRSIDAYLESVEPNRRRWQEALGAQSLVGWPQPATEPEWETFLENDEMQARYITVPITEGLNARAILALPTQRSGPVPLVIAQHGIGSSPEKVMGFDDHEGIYHGYGTELVRAGFAVLAPQNITSVDPRTRLHRMCIMLGFTLWGLEINRLSRLLDVVLAQPEIDAHQVGMWGISLGGAYTIFTMPLEPRIKAGVCTAWFNDRYRKMIIDDPRYSCFLSTNENYVFIPRWLAEFEDSDLVSLICPRPFQVQTGKADGIAWWPFVVDTFDQSREHYIKLGREEAIELDLHEGGHEIDVEAGIRFFKRWLV